MKTLIAIANPKAGHAGKSSLIPSISRTLEKSGIQLKVVETKYSGHATEIARDFYKEGYNHFLCLGGDGTLFEVINGFFQVSNQPDVTLGVIPTGTGNSFLKDFSSSIDHILQSVIQNKTKPTDVIKVKHEEGEIYFINIFSFGFTADVGMVRNKYFSFAGSVGYVMAVLCKLLGLRSKPYSMKLDGQSADTSSSIFVSINNTRFTGGNMMMAPKADPSDGLVDVINAKNMDRWSLLKAFPKIFKGTHTSLSNVQSSKAKSIEFDFNSKIPVMVDGELLQIQPEHLEVLPRAIQIYA